MLCLGEGLLMYLLTVHVIVLCLRLAARLNVKFVSDSNAKCTIFE